jgi:hypothetical protein
LPEKQRPTHGDAFNVTVQRQLGATTSLEVAYVANRGGNVFAGDGPAININQASIIGYPNVPRNQRRPFFNAFGWTQDVDYFCNCATNAYDSLQTRFTKRFSDGYSFQVNYTLQRAVQDSGEYFQTPLPQAEGLFDTDLNRGPADWERTHNLVISLVAELPIGRGRTYLADVSPAMDLLVGGWQFNTNTFIQSGLPFNVSYRGAGADRDTGPNRPDLIGDASGPGPRDQGFNAAPIGSSGSAFGRPAVGTFGDLPRNELRGPGYWRVDASLFKHFRFDADRMLEVRIEAVNLFNHVNLGNPDSEVGVPGNLNPNAGRITSTAYGGSDPQRNFQFAVKFKF